MRVGGSVGLIRGIRGRGGEGGVILSLTPHRHMYLYCISEREEAGRGVSLLHF